MSNCGDGCRGCATCRPVQAALREAHDYIYTMQWKDDPEHRKAQAVCTRLSRAIWSEQQPTETAEGPRHA